MSVYTDLQAFYAKLGNVTGDVKLPALPLAHYPIEDTALAACLVVLGVPFRQPGPYTDTVDLDDKGNERGRLYRWWLAAESDPDPAQDGKCHRTEELFGAWHFRERFEKEFPQHPLNWMRAAIDARAWWLGVIHGSIRLDHEVRGGTELAFGTQLPREAAVLKASGFAPIAYRDRAFFLEPVHDFIPAHQVLGNSHSLEMKAPEQWMRRVLHIQNEMLKLTRRSGTILRQTDENRTLLLAGNSTAKTRDKFQKLFES